MERLLYIFLFACFSLVIFGQDRISNTSVHLKNGSILKGEIINKDQSGDIIILINGQEMVIASDEITYIQTRDVANEIHESNWMNRTSISYLDGSLGSGYGIHHTLYFKYKSMIDIGLGFGVDNYLRESGHNLFPIYSDIIIYLRDSKSTPYVSSSFGYSFAKADGDQGQIEAEGGILFAPRIGYSFLIEDVRLDIFSGLRFQKSRYLYRVQSGEAEDLFNFKRLEIGLGISF